MIEAPGGAVRDYLLAFNNNVAAVYVGKDGRARATVFPARIAGAADVGWTTPADARRIAARLNAVPRGNRDTIAAAAAAIGVQVTPHDRLLERVAAAVAQVDAALSAAK